MVTRVTEGKMFYLLWQQNTEKYKDSLLLPYFFFFSKENSVLHNPRISAKMEKEDMIL